MVRLTLVLSALLLTACNQPQTPVDATPSKLVEVAPVTMSTPSRRFMLSGTTRATRRAEIAPQVSGVIMERPVKLGEHVIEGAILARLENPESEPALEAATARLRELRLQYGQAGRDVQRISELFAKKLAAQHELEQAQTRHKALAEAIANAEAGVKGARHRLAETTIRAPITGMIERIDAEPGEFLAAGQHLLAIAGEGIEVEFNLPETLLPLVSLGRQVTLTLPLFKDRQIAGRIIELGGSTTLPTRLFPVVIALDEPEDLRAGLTVNWTLHSTETPQLMVPIQAIAGPAGSSPRVYRVEGNRASAVKVIPGMIDAARIAVNGALKEGDEVIVAGLNNLIDGHPVEVRR